MRNVLLVDLCQRSQNLVRNFGEMLCRDSFLELVDAGQCDTLHHFHYDVETFSVFDDLLHFGDLWVVQLDQDFNFVDHVCAQL